MTLEFANRTDKIFSSETEALLRKAAEDTLASEDCPFDASASLSMVTEEEIRTHNRDFRGIDRVTDVLSFPMIDFPSPAAFEYAADREDCTDPESGTVFLGDIVICPERAARQAEEYGHSLERELAFLTVHSMLHLLGYDHEEPAEATIMETKQENVLKHMGLER